MTAHRIHTDADSFREQGYAIVDLLTPDEHESIVRLVAERIRQIAAVELPGLAFDPNPLGRYHEHGLSDEAHARLMGPKHRRLHLPADIQSMLLNDRAMKLFESFWSHRAVAIKDIIDREWVFGTCGFRMVRPGGGGDVAGIHSESSYDIMPITMWLPVVGFDPRYTLKLAPGSHLVEHPSAAIVKSKQFTARPYTENYANQFDYIRPAMRKGQAIVFHPRLLHGGSVNAGDETRSSIEIRVYQQSDTKIPDALSN